MHKTVTVLLVSMATLVSCSHLQLPQYVPNVRTIDGFKVSESNWVIDLKGDNSPDCNWLRENKIFGISPVDSYEITTDELCEP